MQMMSELFASGTVVDAVLIFLLVEAIGVIGYWLWRKRGIAPADFLPGMISGALMLLALAHQSIRGHRRPSGGRAATPEVSRWN